MNDAAAELAPVPTRPRVRADCELGPRPCPWVSCRFHLLELHERRQGRLDAGELVLLGDASLEAVEAFTDGVADAVLAMPESCALDVAGRDGVSPEEVGTALGVTRQRANQIEALIMPRVRRRVIAAGLR